MTTKKDIIKSLIGMLLILGIFFLLFNQLFNQIEGNLKEEKEKKKVSIQKRNKKLEKVVGDGDNRTPMCRDWMDKDGTILWKGLSKKEYEQTSQKERREFQLWYDKYVEETHTNSTIIPQFDASISDYFSELCVTYAGKIPFLEGGREYGLEFVDLTNYHKTPMDTTSMKIGLDSTGYLIWLYRNTFGFTPKGMNHLYQLYQTEKRISSKEDLRVGDICMQEQGKKNYYGVIAGFIKEEPVVAWCDSQATNLYKNGASKLGYIKKYTNKYLNGTAPGEFRYFFRLDLDWGDDI